MSTSGKLTEQVQMASNEVLATLCEDLQLSKLAISQIQATFAQIGQRAPTPETYNELVRLTLGDVHVDPELAALFDRTKVYLNLSQVKVAVRLRELMEQHQLPVIDALQKINFKAPRPGKEVTQFLDWEPLAKGSSATPKTITDDAAAWPPILPLISLDVLLLRALTDKLWRLPLDFIELLELNDFSRAHNGKLAVKGALVLRLALVDVIDEAYPFIGAEELNYLVNQAINETALAKFALGYNLLDSYRYCLSDQLPESEKVSLVARVFLAYIGALAADSYSVEAITKWIGKLYKPLLKDLGEFTILLMAENELNFFINLTPENTLEFKETFDDDLGVHTCEVVYGEGEVLGLGTDSESAANARQKAAFAVVGDANQMTKIVRELINRYVQKLKTTEQFVVDSANGASPLTLALPLMQLKQKLDENTMTANVVYNPIAQEIVATIYVKGVSIGEGVDTTKKGALAKAAQHANERSGSWQSWFTAIKKPVKKAALNY